MRNRTGIPEEVITYMEVVDGQNVWRTDGDLSVDQPVDDLGAANDKTSMTWFALMPADVTRKQREGL